MKLIIKTLNGTPFDVQVDPNVTTLQVKEEISKQKGWEVGSQKLIHLGKILADDKPLSEYKVKDNSFLVCMVAKPKSTPSSTPAPPAAESAPTPAPPAPVTETTPPVASTTATAPAQTTAMEEDSFGGLSAAESEASLKQLEDMGFPRTECEAALRAAYGDTSRAVEYLMSGIPPEAAAAAAGGGASTGGQTGTPASSAGLGALRQHPQINAMRRLVQQNPAALSQVLQQIGQSNPQLFQAITNNREEFVRIMNEPVDESETQEGGAGGAPAGLPFGTGGQGPEQFAAVLQAMQQLSPDQRAQLAQSLRIPPEQLQAITQMMQNMPPQAMAQMMESMMQGGGGGGGFDNTITLTPEEAAAVDRLKELGFPEAACLEAYLACDKNETLAANYLFNNPPDTSGDGN